MTNKGEVNGKVLIQGMFLDGPHRVKSVQEIQSYPDATLCLADYQKKKKVGKIVIAIVYCKDLIAQDGDTSDPYLVLKMNSEKRKTKTVKKNCRPVFNELVEFPIELLSESEMTPLLIEFFDEDIGFDDELGVLTLDIKDVFSEPNQWRIDDLFKIEPTKKLLNKHNSFGQLYLKAMFTEDHNLKPQIGALKQNLEEIIQLEEISGRLLINVVHAKQLIRADVQGKADPYVKVELPNGNTVKTKAIQNNLFPEWNQTLECTID